ncbi:hypothetical protein CR513_36940 [Mucuna pruriens]|uniref:Uncharacterized protein n=1 Tax=Mucuna pruriens TaxID=157652 RepID=A0A371FV92_MUCPR|nr:hypothetical protein CR513_36940 [Mucuna pruriens]
MKGQGMNQRKIHGIWSNVKFLHFLVKVMQMTIMVGN